MDRIKVAFKMKSLEICMLKKSDKSCFFQIADTKIQKNILLWIAGAISIELKE